MGGVGGGLGVLKKWRMIGSGMGCFVWVKNGVGNLRKVGRVGGGWWG